jgi:Viral BACON domain
MSPQSVRSLLTYFVAFGTLAAPAFAQARVRKDAAVYQGDNKTAAPKARPLSFSVPIDVAPTVRMDALSTEEAKKIGSVGSMRRIGVHRELPDTAVTAGKWTVLPNGRSIWRLSVGSASAAGVRVHFTDFSVGDGQVWIYALGSSEADGPYTGQGPYGNGDFWSASVAGENAIIEYAAASAGPVPFHLAHISHLAARIDQEMEAGKDEADRLAGFRNLIPFDTFATTPTTYPDYAASCNADVQCYPDWQTTKKSVAHIQFEEDQGDEQGAFVCSAALVATRDNSFKPYLLTAGHCIHDEDAARSLQTWWAFESPGCNQGPPTDRGSIKSSNGGHLLAWGPLHLGDFSMVLLPDVPSGVVFSGWDFTDLPLGTAVTGIHHPMGSYKRISFGSTVSSETVDINGDRAPAPLYTSVIWDRGIAEPGSSGSPLFSGPGVITGMLSYGPSLPGEILCESGFAVGYAKFSNAYPYLIDYLENLPGTVVTPSVTSLSFTSQNRKLVGAASQKVNLAVLTTTAIPFSVRPDADWLNVSQTSGTISASAPVTIQVTVNPSFFVKAGTYTSTITILSGAAAPQFINVTVNAKIDASNVTVSAIPNPVQQVDNVWTLKMHVVETGGNDTKLVTLRIDGNDYSGNIVKWFGTNLLSANATLEGTIHASGIYGPADLLFEFIGQDVATGASWYRTMTVTFLQ